jgi:hypothetical protein
MEKNYKWSSSGFDFGTIAFSYLYKRPTTATDSDTKVVLFADDTCIIINSPNQERHQTALNKTLSDINLLFKGNFVSLNFNKTYYLQFRTKITLTIY